MINLEDKKRKENSFLDPTITVGIVGHCKLEALTRIKQFFQEQKDFDVVYIKATSGKLWIKEGENGDY